MPETVVKSPFGDITVTHPQGATDEQIIAYAKQNYSAAPGKVAEDVGQSVAAAPRKVAEGIIGLPGTIERGITGAQNWLNEKVVQGLNKIGIDEKPTPLKSYLPTPETLQADTSKVIGPSYQPQTPYGKYAGSAAEGALGATLGPGRFVANLLMGTGAGLGAEAGKEYAPDHPIIGSLIGGIAGGGVVGGLRKGLEAARNYGAAANAGQKVGQILGIGDVPAGAVRRVAKNLEEDKVTLPGAVATQQQLGPAETMVMDLGRQLQGRAEEMAVHRGSAQNTVLNAVEGRTGKFGEETSRRVAQDLDANLGKSENVVQLIDSIDAAVKKHTGPAYEALKLAHPNISMPTNIVERPSVATAMKQAEGIAADYGRKVSASAPDFEYWDYVKKAMDQRINGFLKNGMDDLSSAQKTTVGGIIDAKNSLVSHLDAVTGGEYARARAVAATKPELHEALDYGRGIFNTKKLPEEVAADVANMSWPARVIAQIGARKEIERVIETTRNEGATARRFLDINYNEKKLAALFGQSEADAISRRIKAENTFQDATEKIAKNSRTAVRTELKKDTETLSPNDVHATLTGMVTSPVRMGLAYALQHGMEKTRGGIADILTAKEGALPAVVEHLLNYNTKKAAHQTAPTGQQLGALARALMAQQVGQ